MRLGPFVCAEWNFGGLPVWLRDLPGVIFRDNNPVWKREMATWMRRITQEIEPWLARHGGPVMMLQMENEYNSGWFGAWEPVEYIEWAGALARNLSLDVPTMMCNGLSANGTLNACNGNDCSTYAASHGVEYPGQPLLWAEDEMGASGWGAGNAAGPRAQDVSRSIARWVALGAAHHNYYSKCNSFSSSQKSDFFALHCSVLRRQPRIEMGGDVHRQCVRRHGSDAQRPPAE